MIHAERLAEILPQLPPDCRLLSLKPASFDPALAVIGRAGDPAAEQVALQASTPFPILME